MTRIDENLVVFTSVSMPVQFYLLVFIWTVLKLKRSTVLPNDFRLYR